MNYFEVKVIFWFFSVETLFFVKFINKVIFTFFVARKTILFQRKQKKSIFQAQKMCYAFTLKKAWFLVNCKNSVETRMAKLFFLQTSKWEIEGITRPFVEVRVFVCFHVSLFSILTVLVRTVLKLDCIYVCFNCRWPRENSNEIIAGILKDIDVIRGIRR